MVARNHLYRNAGFLAFSDRRNGFKAGRVNHPLQAQEGHSSRNMAMLEFRVVKIDVTADKREDAKSTEGHLLDSLMHGLSSGPTLPSTSSASTQRSNRRSTAPTL
jgi:hypothetical protein